MQHLAVFLIFLFKLISYVDAQEIATTKPPLKIKISASTNVERAFINATEKTPCYLLTHDQIKSLYRAELEIIIACKAIFAAGVIPDLHIISSPNYFRSIYMVENGDVDMSAQTIWQEEINSETMLFSRPVVTTKELEKGLYALSNHPIFSDPSMDFTQLKGGTVKNWIKDISALKKVTDDVYLTYRYSSIYTMLKAKRIDFTLLAFPATKDLTINEEEGIFKPIPNVKVQLAGSRHFILSKRNKRSEIILEYINIGLEKMRTSGELTTLFYTSGIINENVRHWKVLN